MDAREARNWYIQALTQELVTFLRNEKNIYLSEQQAEKLQDWVEYELVKP
jgi:hypothetical protein